MDPKAVDAITTLFRHATLLSYGLDGLLETMQGSRPILAWVDELSPFRDLAGELVIGARELYCLVEPDVEARAKAAQADWVAAAWALARQEEAATPRMLGVGG